MQGYFSLIQYSEFPERHEFVNIGIVIFTAEVPRVKIKFTNDFRRVEQSFGIKLGKHFSLQIESMRNRILSDFSNSWNKEQINRFLALRSSKIRLSSPKSILVKVNSEEVLEELLESFVAGKVRKPREQQVRTKLKAQFKNLNVEDLLDKQPRAVPLPQGVTVKAPYGYQNGSYNMINPISLKDNPDQALKNASSQAVEGKWLNNHSINSGVNSRLIVVGDLEGQQHNFVVAIRELMEKNSVAFHALDDLNELADDIKRNVSSIVSNAGFSDPEFH